MKLGVKDERKIVTVVGDKLADPVKAGKEDQKVKETGGYTQTLAWALQHIC